jgi:hypothetical protein
MFIVICLYIGVPDSRMFFSGYWGPSLRSPKYGDLMRFDVSRVDQDNGILGGM